MNESLIKGLVGMTSS